MNSTQRGIAWVALAAIGALLVFAPFTYSAENALAAGFGQSRPGTTGRFHAPIWTSADDAATNRIHAAGSAGVMQVSDAQLDAGRLGLYLGIVVIIAAAAIALTASKKTDTAAA